MTVRILVDFINYKYITGRQMMMLSEMSNAESLMLFLDTWENGHFCPIAHRARASLEAAVNKFYEKTFKNNLNHDNILVLNIPCDYPFKRCQNKESLQ
jgi:hypothetical protein